MLRRGHSRRARPPTMNNAVRRAHADSSRRARSSPVSLDRGAWMQPWRWWRRCAHLVAFERMTVDRTRWAAYRPGSAHPVATVVAMVADGMTVAEMTDVVSAHAASPPATHQRRRQHRLRLRQQQSPSPIREVRGPGRRAGRPRPRATPTHLPQEPQGPVPHARCRLAKHHGLPPAISNSRSCTASTSAVTSPTARAPAAGSVRLTSPPGPLLPKPALRHKWSVVARRNRAQKP